jgi:hypothetical protein
LQHLSWAVPENFDFTAIDLATVAADGEEIAFLDRVGSPRTLAAGLIDS